jgi:hypothetical protein
MLYWKYDKYPNKDVIENNRERKSDIGLFG